MKRFLFFICLIILLTGNIDTVVYAAALHTQTQPTTTVPETMAPAVILPEDDVSTEDIALYSASVCVMDADSGAVLYYKNKDQRHYPASITKVMTGLLLIENSNSLSDEITFSADCWDGINYFNDMNIGMLDGEKLTVDQALHAMLMASANEVCNGVAKYVAGSVPDFVEMMNKKAEALGCTDTHFVTANGLHDEKHYVTAYDMALIARAAINNPVFRRITGTPEYIIKSTNLRPEGFPIAQKHKMLMYTDYHYDACIGGKTGYTTEAKNTLVTYAEKNGMSLVCITLYNTNGTLYDDTIKVLDYCFDNYHKESAYSDHLSSDLVTSSLPFTGFDIGIISDRTDHSGSIIRKNDADDTLTSSLQAAKEAVAVKPYTSSLNNEGRILYYDPSGNIAGYSPYYKSLYEISYDYLAGIKSETASTETKDNDEADETHTNEAQESKTPESDITAAAEGEPDLITLKDISAEDNNTPLEGLSFDSFDSFISSVSVIAAWVLYIGELWILNNPLYAFAGFAIFFIVITILVIWLKGVSYRRRHRRNFKRMRKNNK